MSVSHVSLFILIFTQNHITMEITPTYIKDVLAALAIEQLNPMQEASIDAWKEGKDRYYFHPPVPERHWPTCYRLSAL